MKITRFFLLTLLLTFVSCERYENKPQHRADHSTEDVDNTGRNIRDRELKTLTPTDQLENEADLKITQQIRASLMDDESLSTNAKNIKIITIHGVVTLRGVVNSWQEQVSVLKKVNSVSGIKRLDNQLEVKESK